MRSRSPGHPRLAAEVADFFFPVCATDDGTLINIRDAYQDDRFNKEVDKKTGYLGTRLGRGASHAQPHTSHLTSRYSIHRYLTSSNSPVTFLWNGIATAEGFSIGFAPEYFFPILICFIISTVESIGPPRNSGALLRNSGAIMAQFGAIRRNSAQFGAIRRNPAQFF